MLPPARGTLRQEAPGRDFLQTQWRTALSDRRGPRRTAIGRKGGTTPGVSQVAGRSRPHFQRPSGGQIQLHDTLSDEYLVARGAKTAGQSGLRSARIVLLDWIVVRVCLGRLDRP